MRTKLDLLRRKRLLEHLHFNKVVLITFLFVLNQQLFAASYYINDNSTTGDIYCSAAYNAGAHSGTAANPSNTFAQLLTDVGTLAAGDIVNIDAGTYSWSAGITPNASGTAGNVITIRGAGITLTLITVTSGVGLISNDMDYITVSAIDLINTGDKVCSISTGSTNWTISSCKFEGTNQYGLYFNASINCNNHTISSTTVVTTGQVAVYAGAAVHHLTFTSCTLTAGATSAYQAATGTSYGTFTSCTISNTSGTLVEMSDNESYYTFTTCTLTAGNGKALNVSASTASSNFTITGGTISATGDHALNFAGIISNVSISNVAVTSSNNSPIRFNAATTTVTMTNSTFTATTGGSVVFFISGGSGFTVTDCTFTSSGTGKAMEVNLTGSSDFTFDGCTFTAGTGSNGIYIAVNSSNYEFIDCTIAGRTMGLLVQGGSSDYTLTNCTISSTTNNGIEIDGNSTDWTITGGSVTSPDNSALYCSAAITSSTFSGVTFAGSLANDGAIRMNSNATGLVVIDDCTITNSANGGWGINLGNSSQNCTISDNTINCTGASGNNRGIYFQAGNANNLVEHNTVNITFNGGTSYGIELNTGDNNSVLRNKISGGDIGIYLAGGGGTGVIVDNNHVCNAIIGLTCATASFSGTALIHNSFYTSKECIYGPFASWDIRNNIFYTTGNGSYTCFYLQNTSDPTTCNYNIYYHPNGAVCGKRNGTSYAALVANWRNVFSSNDGNSLEANPIYNNPPSNNLYPATGSPAVGAGTYLLAGDLPGNSRANPGPTIGAYETYDPLPVQLILFEAEKYKKDVLLTWQTASEINSSHFEILHSTNGVDFEVLATIGAAGNSYHRSDYYYIHQNPEEGIHYYQLVEYDNDGSFEKFKIVAVNINNKVNVITQLFPNPASENITLYFNSTTGGLYKLTITDMIGKTLYVACIPSIIGENKFKISLEPYEEGTYFIHLIDPNGGISSEKVIKKN